MTVSPFNPSGSASDLVSRPVCAGQGSALIKAERSVQLLSIQRSVQLNKRDQLLVEPVDQRDGDGLGEPTARPGRIGEYPLDLADPG